MTGMAENNGLFEVAVLEKFIDDEYTLCYSTPITDDVIGYLTDTEVCNILNKIKKLK